MNPSFLDLLDQRIFFMDGAMGTAVHAQDLSVEDFGGEEYEGCPEILNLIRPDVIRSIHRSYYEAGADVVLTNTFGAPPWVLAEYGLVPRLREIALAAARLAREAADEFFTPERPRFVAGSMGSGTKLATLGHIPYDEMEAGYAELSGCLLEGGVDLIQIETVQDLLQAKAAVNGARKAMAAEGRRVPVSVSLTFEQQGTMLLGSEAGAALAALDSLDFDILGLNCATGPAEMRDHLRFLSRHSRRPLYVKPNAGIPENVDGHAHYPLGPEVFSRLMREIVEDFGAAIVGGCCGCHADHLRALIEAVRRVPSRPRRVEPLSQAASLYQAFPLRQSPPPLIVGERANSYGSKKFKEFLEANDYDGMVGVAAEQQEEGVHAVDLCVAYVGRDEATDMREFVSRLRTKITVPIMIDSTKAAVIEEALKLYPGKAIVNSVNLEDGEERLEQVLPLVRRFGAAVVAGTIDEEGMGRTADRKVAIAERLHDIIVKRYGVPEGDLIFDPLIFTVSNPADERAGLETLEAIRRIKERLPVCHTLLGLSNVSFGLKPYMRRVLNSVYFHHAVEAGLDQAIVNYKGITPIHELDPEHVELARRLIYCDKSVVADPLTDFIDRLDAVKGKRPAEAKVDEFTLPVEEVLRRKILKRDKKDLPAHLDRALERYAPMEIINEILLDAMREVGRLMDKGQMPIPFVLQAAEVMKESIRHLEPLMKGEGGGGSRGTLVLGTVKGDVHDIGKDLVEIVISNNGYKVVNLGIRVTLETFLDAWERHNADAIGMSGLLHKSVEVMRENIEELNRRGLCPRLILGGAALTQQYVENTLRGLYEGEVYYGRDAFSGLHIVNELTDPAVERAYTRVVGRTEVPEEEAPAAEAPEDGAEVRSPSVREEAEVPEPPFWGSRVLEGIEPEAIYPYMNLRVLFRGRWGYRRSKGTDAEHEEYLRREITPVLRRYQEWVTEEKLLASKIVYGYFPAQGEGNDLIIYRPGGEEEWTRFRFPRQRRGERLCISDFFAPRESGKMDVCAFSLVTAGERISETVKHLKETDQYNDFWHLSGLAAEYTDALAEYVHRRVREELGIADEDAEEIEKFFQMKYRGVRYSFGYPACPELEDQTKLMEILEGERIGVTLSDVYFLVPEFSTSALIAHHPQARYFNAADSPAHVRFARAASRASSG